MADPPGVVFFADYRFDHETLELRRGDEPVALAPKPARILAELLSRPGRIVSREELYSVGWDDGTVSVDLALNTAIRNVRRALKERAEDKGFIQTFPGRGYRFAADVLTEAPPQPGLGVDGTADRYAGSGSLRVLRPWTVAAAAVLALAGSALVVGPAPQPTVAVEPIRVLDGSLPGFRSEVLEASIRSGVARSAGREYAVLSAANGRSTETASFLVRGSLYSLASGESRLDVQIVRGTTRTIVWSGWFDPDCPYVTDTAAYVAGYVARIVAAQET